MTRHLLLTIAMAAAGSLLQEADAQYLQVNGITPSPGATVKSLSTVKIEFGLNTGEGMAMPIVDDFSGITLTSGEGGAVSATEVTPDVDNWPINTVIINFPAVTAPGTYTLSVPADVFAECVWSDEADNFVPLEELTNSPISAVYTVSADAASVFDNYILTPAAGSKVARISEIGLSFPDAPYSIERNDELEVTISNGTTTYPGTVGGWGNENITIFFEEGYDEVVITEEGMWKLSVPQGLFSADGEESPAIEAEYEVTTNVDFPVTFEPANGSTQELPDGHAINVNFMFDTASEVDLSPYYDDAYIRVSYNGQPIAKVSNALNDYGWQAVDNWGDPLYTVRLNKDIFTTNGELLIEADKGAFTVDGLPSPEITYTLKFGENRTFDYILTPEAGAYDELQSFSLTFLESNTIELVEGSYIVLTGERVYQQYKVDILQPDCYCPESAVITFDPAPYVAGDYRLIIEEGAFIIDGTYLSPAITVDYTLNRVTEIDMSCNPSPEGEKVIAEDYGTYVAFVFAEDEKVVPQGGFADKISVEFDGVTLTRGTDYAIEVGGEDAFKVLVNIEGNSPYVGKEGELKVTIGAGAFTIGGEEFEGTSHTWQVVRPKTYGFVLDPEAGATVKSLETITVSFPAAETATLFRNNYITLRAADYSGYFQNPASAEAIEGLGCPAYKLTFDPAPDKDGDYVLSFNYYAFQFDGVQNSENYDVTYTLDTLNSVDAIKGAAENVTVYSVDGRKVLDNAAPEALEQLSDGLYIVNGKKVLVRK